MLFDFSEEGKVKIDMTNYVEAMIEDFSVNLKASNTAPTPAAEDLFQEGKGKELDQDQAEAAAGPAVDMFDWVIQSTLNTLDERGDDLQGSIHSSDDSSKGSGRGA